MESEWYVRMASPYRVRTSAESELPMCSNLTWPVGGIPMQVRNSARPSPGDCPGGARPVCDRALDVAVPLIVVTSKWPLFSVCAIAIPARPCREFRRLAPWRRLCSLMCSLAVAPLAEFGRARGPQRTFNIMTVVGGGAKLDCEAFFAAGNCRFDLIA